MNMITPKTPIGGSMHPHLKGRGMSEANPWGLSPAEARAMDAMCAHGCAKRAGRALNRSPNTIECQIYDASLKMGFPSGDRLLRYLTWDRWRQAGSPVRQEGETQ